MKLKLFFSILVLIFSPVFIFAVSFAADNDSIAITTYYPSPYGSYNELTTSGNTYLATSSGSKVGIGTTTPQAPLQVGLTHSSGYATNGGKILISDEPLTNGPEAVSGIEFGSNLYPNGYATKLYTSNVGDRWGIATRFNSALWTERLVVKEETGNVGIGTINPQAPLEISSSVLNPLTIKGGLDQQFYISGVGLDLLPTCTVCHDGPANFRLWAGTWADITSAFYITPLVAGNSNPPPALMIDSAGNVAIGSGYIPPMRTSAKLYVYGRIRAKGGGGDDIACWVRNSTADPSILGHCSAGSVRDGHSDCTCVPG